MKKNILSAVLITVFILSGCIQIPLESGSDKDDRSKSGACKQDCPKNKSGGFYYGSYYGYWWGNSPEDDMMAGAQQDGKGKVDTRGLYRVVYASDYLSSVASILSLGIVVPVQVNWWLEDEQKNNLPKEIKHSRKENSL